MSYVEPGNPISSYFPRTCYKLDAILFVPHYTHPGTYVGPGSVMVSEASLKAKGALPVKEYLWERVPA